MPQKTMSDMNRLSTIVRHLCKYQGVKMNVIAERMGISPATLSRNLSNDNPREDSMNRYADAFGVPRDVFKEYYHNPKGYEVSSAEGRLIIVPKEINYSLPSVGNEDVEDVPLTKGYSSLADKDSYGTLKTKKPMTEGTYMIDEETGEEVWVPDNEMISANFNYRGTKLYAYSVQDIKDIANVLLSLTSITDKEQHEATLSLLVRQYGRKKRG